LRISLRTLEREAIHDAVNGTRRKLQRQQMIGYVERHLQRKQFEDLINLVRGRK